MCAVHQHQRVPLQHLEPPRPNDRVQTRPHGRFRYFISSVLSQYIHGVQRHGGIFILIVADQPQAQVSPVPIIQRLPVQSARTQHLRLRVRDPQSAAPLFAGPAHHSLHLRRLSGENHIRAGFDDAGFLSGDLFKSVSQHLRVLQGDVGDHRRIRRVDDVGGIQASAQTHLQNHHVAVFLLEIQKRHGGNPLKFRGRVRHFLSNRLHLLRKPGQFVIGDIRTVHLHPLVDAEEMGGRIKSRGISGAGQNLGQHGADGAFSIRTRHMDEPQLLLGIVQKLHQ
ncbi:hypothetical protein SDC9_68356 [bioreactor metagenome]|uniref:Uncharacterized protein n=1 Tax=bioreactor metagenome TaxID=1076179 RepID=A0A644Y080_9ZZZZ